MNAIGPIGTDTDQFWGLGYTVVPGLVDAGQRAFVRAAMDAANKTGQMGPATKVRAAIDQYSPIAGEALLLKCLPAVEAIAGCAVLPSYAHWRIYDTGSFFHPHTDRKACEITVSIPIFALSVDDDWSLNICDFDGDEVRVALPPGDALVYQGCAVPHWRDPFMGERQYQVFLHYVIKDGFRAAHAFDGREGLSVSTQQSAG